MESIKVPKTLTYLGITPFAGSLLLAIVNLFMPFTLEKNLPFELAHSYGIVIVSFLAGIQWGVSLPANQPHKYFLLSNVFTLLAWLTCLQLGRVIGLLGLILIFIAVLMSDSQLIKTRQIPAWFWRLRKIASAWVITLLMTMAVLKLIN